MRKMVSGSALLLWSKKKESQKVGAGRNVVDTACVNSSNPYHRCTEHCSRRTKVAKSDENGEINQEGMVMVEKRNVDSMCINASNPYHRCMKSCSKRSPEARRQIKEGKSVQTGEKNNKEGRVVGEGRNMDPMCVNTSKPYNQCKEYCQINPEARRQIKEGKTATVQNGERTNEEWRVVGKGRNVDPMCINASNPYHKCTKYCSQRAPQARRRTGGNKLEIMEELKMREKIKVYPKCVNASKLHHKCTKYCFQENHEMGQVERGKSEESRGGIKKVERRNVNPKCTYKSNPYHKCSEYCLQRI